MVSILTLSVVDHVFEPQFGPKTIKLVFVASPLSTQHSNKAGWSGIRIMFPSGATCLTTNCYSELALKNTAKCVGLVQSDHHHLIEV